MSLEYLNQLIAQPEELTQPSPEAMYDRLEREEEWLQEALEEANRSDPRLGLEAAYLLRGYWFARGRITEGREWLDRLLTSAGEAATIERARGLVAASGLAFRQGDNAAAKSHAQTALEAARSAGWSDVETNALLCLARAGLRDQDPDSVRKYASAARLSALSEKDESGELSAIHCLAEAERMAGNLDEATDLYTESLRRNRELGSVLSVSTELTNFAYVHKAHGRLDEGEASAREAIAISTSIGNSYLLAHNCVALAAVLAAKGKSVDAARALGHADSIFEETGLVLDPADTPEYDEAAVTARQALGEESATSKSTETGSCSMPRLCDRPVPPARFRPPSLTAQN